MHDGDRREDAFLALLVWLIFLLRLLLPLVIRLLRDQVLEFEGGTRSNSI